MSDTMTDQEFEDSARVQSEAQEPSPESAPVAEGETAEAGTEAKVKRATVKYEFEMLDELPEKFDVPTAAPKRGGSHGWRGRVEEVIKKIEAGEVPLRGENGEADPVNGVTPWLKLATYTSTDGADNAYKAIAKRQRKYKAALANDEAPEEESILPDAWNAEIEARPVSATASILAIRMWRKNDA